MGRYVEIDDVRTWYVDRGTGPTVVLLHGGFTDGRDFEGNLLTLADDHRVLVPDRRAHGRSFDPGGPLTLEVMAQDTATFIESIADEPVSLIGYSAGAVVALRLATKRPDLLRSLVLISGAYDPQAMLVRPSLDGPAPPPLVEAYGEVSPHGAGHFEDVRRRLVESFEAIRPLTPDALAQITCPSLVMGADDDLVALDHTTALFQHLPDSRLAILPGTSHMLLHEKPEQCFAVIKEFIENPEVASMMPVRRSQPAPPPT